jgi:hypothetical protein
MSGGVSSRIVSRSVHLVLLLVGLALTSAEFATAQVHGVPPSVTSIQFHVPPFLPNIMPSVTSLGPHAAYNPSPFPAPYGVPRTIYGRGIYGHAYKNHYGYGYGTAYAVPYYVPAYDTSEGYDPGPYLYSGPPAEQTLHIVVDTPPARHEVADDIQDSLPPEAAQREHDAGPVDPTVLVFRDGHKQEVSNYAIMGQTVYVFDARTQKIALGDLDVPATIKANDDRGVEFQIPKSKQSKATRPARQQRDDGIPENLLSNSASSLPPS